MKKSWLVVGALVGAVAVTAISGVARAQTATPDPTATATATAEPAAPKAALKTYKSRLAKKLSISEDGLTSGIKSVQREKRREMQDERVAEILAKAVVRGKLTQPEADSYLTWWKSRPDTFPMRAQNLGSFKHHQKRNGPPMAGGRDGHRPDSRIGAGVQSFGQTRVQQN